MKKIAMTVALSLLVLMGCRTTTVKYYVVQRDVPISPTFVVIPFNAYQPQVLCAEFAESALVAAGVKVVMPPFKKIDVEIKKSIDGEQAKLGQGQEPMRAIGSKGESASLEAVRAYQTRVERFSEYEDIDADYTVRTNGIIYSPGDVITHINVRIIKNASNEILSSFLTYPDTISEDMYKILESSGFKVKKKT
jgi:hypothetical protein